jgi:hypothetical protein
MYTTEIAHTLSSLFAELVEGARHRGDATVLNSGDSGLLQSLANLSPNEASQTSHGGASIAAHAVHLSIGLALMNRWSREGSDPFSDPSWDDAWKTSSVDAAEWSTIRASLEREAREWLATLHRPRVVSARELRALIASAAHLAYHFGAIRQIHKATRGPQRGTFP